MRKEKVADESLQPLERVALISSECLCHQDADDEKPFLVSCLQFFLTERITTQISGCSTQVIHFMVNTISSVLLDTIIKGDPRVQEANITWVEQGKPSSPTEEIRARGIVP